ncbi:MAG: hypothetical protein PHC64_08615 [Candidatus Gastranaerophilales bacterium]|nr:hypothetical protein [Candidatus Gastranaerophilales bacterium]
MPDLESNIVTALQFIASGEKPPEVNVQHAVEFLDKDLVLKAFLEECEKCRIFSRMLGIIKI